MTGLRCAVASCKNNLEKTKGTNIQYHRFPKNETLRNLWVKKCQRPIRFNEENSRICSVHFKPQDFEVVNALRCELMNTKLIRKLKAGAIPSLCLSTAEDPKPLQNVVIKLADSSRIVPVKIHTIKDQQPDYNGIIKKLVQANAELKKKLVETTKDGLKNHIYELQGQILTKDIALKEAQRTKEFLFSGIKEVLTKRQIDKAILKKKKILWTLEDIKRALVIRYCNTKCYHFLRKDLAYPLPRLNILRKWVSKLSVHRGLLPNIFMFLEVAGKAMNKRDRVAVIQFDEMKVNSLYEYCEKTDEIVGPHSYMQTILIRGLFSDWQQPLYISFDQKITTEILLDSIRALHVFSFEVVACVSDCAGGNTTLWDQLGVSMENPAFPHPVTKNNIFYLTDVPSLLKLVRNWLLNTGFEQPSGEIVNESPLKHLVNNSDTETKKYHKLTEEHINSRGSSRMNITLATELLSHSTANALIYQKEVGPDKKLVADTASFIENISNWYNVVNCCDSDYGSDLKYQDAVLLQTNEIMKSMRCIGRSGLMTFQKAIIMTNTSFKLLLEEMRSRYNVEQIAGNRLNLGHLMDFFLILSDDCKTHPDPLECLRKVSDIMFGKNDVLANYATEYLVHKVLRRSNLLSVPKDNSKNETNDVCQNEIVNGDDESKVVYYIAARIAEQFIDEYPYLSKVNETDHDYTTMYWKKDGDLMEPSSVWQERVQAMDRHFQALHRNGIKKCSNIVEELEKKIMGSKLKKEFPQTLVRTFALLRIKLRIHFLNKKLQNGNKSLKRVYENVEEDVKFKLRKVID